MKSLRWELSFFIDNKYKNIIEDNTSWTCLKSQLAQGILGYVAVTNISLASQNMNQLRLKIPKKNKSFDTSN